jgi:antitoxin (DNA-binding transcriptional repressor) of toxin-antitoxin stability system
MADTVNLYDAKTHLSQLVERAAAGEEIVIAKAGKPKAKLVYPMKRRPRNAWMAKISSALLISPMISMVRCRPKSRNISTAKAKSEVATRNARFAVVGSGIATSSRRHSSGDRKRRK